MSRSPKSATQSERGAAAVELALFGAILCLLVGASVGALRLVADNNHLNQVTEAATRYATRSSQDPNLIGTYRTRPTAAEVTAYVESISNLPVTAVEVTPDPTTAFPGDEVTVVVTVHHDAGPLADVANSLAGLIGQDPIFPDGGMELRSAVTMREE